MMYQKSIYLCFASDCLRLPPPEIGPYASWSSAGWFTDHTPNLIFQKIRKIEFSGQVVDQDGTRYHSTTPGIVLEKCLIDLKLFAGLSLFNTEHLSSPK